MKTLTIDLEKLAGHLADAEVVLDVTAIGTGIGSIVAFKKGNEELSAKLAKICGISIGGGRAATYMREDILEKIALRDGHVKVTSFLTRNKTA